MKTDHESHFMLSRSVSRTVDIVCAACSRLVTAISYIFIRIETNSISPFSQCTEPMNQPPQQQGSKVRFTEGGGVYIFHYYCWFDFVSMH